GRGPDELAATVEAGPAAGSGILRTLTALGVVIGLVLVTRVLIQKLGGRGWTGPSRANLVEVLARAPIGGKNEVLFLKIRQQVLVIGQCPSGLSTLWCMQEPEDVAWLLGQVEASRPRSISDGFRQLLKTAETDYGADAESEPAVDASEAATEGARAEISGLMARLDLLRRGQGEGSR
ncbi:MAG: flagellar biosynthetic protein FliO, partial [Phycisphaerae bacterium]|nr:flagellar biosynthetic protein FliO [Phycisphaerae bacterium]